jgi:hypothetical protein
VYWSLKNREHFPVATQNWWQPGKDRQINGRPTGRYRLEVPLPPIFAMTHPIDPQFDTAIRYLNLEAQSIYDYQHCGEMPECEAGETEEAYKDIQGAITFLTIARLGGLSALVSRIRQYGINASIIGADGKTRLIDQYATVCAEIGTIGEGLRNFNQTDMIEGIGHSAVALIHFADLIESRFESCLLAAHENLNPIENHAC